jgi:hypothetical protein
MRETIWSFETKNFLVTASIVPDNDLDLSWDESHEIGDKLESGEYQAFGTIVSVYHKGKEIGSDSLWGSIYSDPREFFQDHRSADPLNRNSSIMRAAKGERAVICHYFPDMVRGAIRDARNTLRTKLRA